MLTSPVTSEPRFPLSSATASISALVALSSRVPLFLLHHSFRLNFYLFSPSFFSSCRNFSTSASHNVILLFSSLYIALVVVFLIFRQIFQICTFCVIIYSATLLAFPVTRFFFIFSSFFHLSPFSTCLSPLTQIIHELSQLFSFHLP